MVALDFFRRSPDVTPQYEDEYAGDPCTTDGANRLKAKIEAYWTAHGYATPQVSLKPVGFVPAMRSSRVDLRSDMINGYPRLRALPASEDTQ